MPLVGCDSASERKAGRNVQRNDVTGKGVTKNSALGMLESFLWLERRGARIVDMRTC